MRTAVLPLLGAAVAAACAPSLDWRDTRPEGSGATLLFPCRPERSERGVRLLGAASRMRMVVCSVGGSTYALAYVVLDDPAAVGPALIELRARAGANVGGRTTTRAVPAVAGSTPNRDAARIGIVGRLPDGTAVAVEALFATRGLTVYQASVIGRALDGAAVDTFLSSLKLAP